VDRTEKAAMVQSLNQLFANTGVVVVTHNSGLTVAEMSDLRRRVSAAGGSYRIAKNRLAKIALEGTVYAPIARLFQGPCGVATSGDPIAAAKAAVGYSKENNKLVILGGAMGATVLDPNGIKALAELPSLDELRGKIIGLIQAPASKIARTLSAPGAQLARVIQAYASKDAA
jgi:large subunit ribosomal protein L10